MSGQDKLSGWDAGKAEAKKRFGGHDATTPEDSRSDSRLDSTGAAAGLAEAKHRFGNRPKSPSK